MMRVHHVLLARLGIGQNIGGESGGGHEEQICGTHGGILPVISNFAFSNSHFAILPAPATLIAHLSSHHAHLS
jgi:hypothetical protein